MASSSNVDVSWNSPTSFAIRNRYCRCHRKAIIKISKSQRNPNKLYFCYSNCRFFQWYEGPEEGELAVKEDKDNQSCKEKN